MTECQWCESMFEVTFDDPDSRVEFCPACGEDITTLTDDDIVEEDFWDD